MNEYDKEEMDREAQENSRTGEASPSPTGEENKPQENQGAPQSAGAAASSSEQGSQQPGGPAPGSWPDYSGQGYYTPPKDPGAWQRGRYNPTGTWQGDGWGQRPWQQTYTTGWQNQQSQWQQPGYRPQKQTPPDGQWNPTGPEGSEKKKRRGPLRVFLSILGCLVALAVVTMAGYGIYTAVTGDNPLAALPGGNPESSSTPKPNSVPEMIRNDKPFGADDQYDGSGNGSLSNTEIYDKVSPSVVGVISYLSNSIYGSENQGSGIIMTEDGYIITNAHVVDGGVSYEVVLTNGESYPAQLVGSDLNSDLAVLKVDQTGLTYAEFGNSDQLKVGERVCAIGNPTGLRLQSSLTVGYVSALGRTINTGGYSMDCIQTDAAINPGNSGGPLINAYGQVIGINSAKIAETDYEGIGFAIPITDAMPILQELIANGKVTGRAMLGITAQAVSASDAEYYQIPLGLWVVSVTPGSDIAAKGVREGDIITHIQDSPIYSLDACSSILQEYSPGDTVEITVFRRENITRDTTFQVEVILSGS